MNQFFSLEFSSGPFVLFSPSHLSALGTINLLLLLLVISRNRLTPQQKQAIRYSAAALLVFNEIMWHIWNFVTGQWTLQKMLPLHLCSVLVWLSAYMLVKKSYRIYEFAYLLGIPGALQALLTPDLGIYDFPHFRYYQVFVSHGLIVLSAIYVTLVENYRPHLNSLKSVFIFSNLFMVAVTALNLIIGSNYLFTAHKPETASLLDVLPPWPWYLIIIELLGLVFMALFYLPFAIKDFARRKSITELP